MKDLTPYKVRTDKNGIVTYYYRCCVGRDTYNKQIWRNMKIEDDGSLPKTEKKLESALKNIGNKWAEEQREEYKKEKQSTFIARNESVKFEAFVNTVWLANHVDGGIGKNRKKSTTKSFYRNIADNLIVARQFKGRDIKDITGDDIDNYLAELSSSGKYSDSTIKHYYDVIRIIFNFAVKKKYIKPQDNPILIADTIQIESKKVDFLNEDEYLRFKNALENYAPLEWRLMMTILVDNGLRRSEAVGLTWNDIDIENETISIARAVTYDGSNTIVDTPKTELSARILPFMSDELKQLFIEWKEKQQNSFGVILTGNAYLFSSQKNPYNPMNPQTPTRWLRRFEEKYGLPKKSPHDLRHTAGSRMQSHGVSGVVGATMLGHTNMSTYKKNYVGLDVEGLRTAAADIMRNSTTDKKEIIKNNKMA